MVTSTEDDGEVGLISPSVNETDNASTPFWLLCIVISVTLKDEVFTTSENDNDSIPVFMFSVN